MLDKREQGRNIIEVPAALLPQLKLESHLFKIQNNLSELKFLDYHIVIRFSICFSLVLYHIVKASHKSN